MQIPRVSSLTARPPEQGYNRRQAQPSAENFEMPELEENLEEEQFTNFDSFMTHHNTHQASEHIQQEYFSHLQDLDNDQYYTEIDSKFSSVYTGCTIPSSSKPPRSSMMIHGRTQKNIWKRQRSSQMRRTTRHNHLALEPILCKAAFNTRSRRISICMKGTLPTVNISILFVHNVSVASCQVHIKGYRLNVQHNNNMQNQDINPLTQTSKLGID